MNPSEKIMGLDGKRYKIFEDPLKFARKAEGDINHAMYFYLSPE